jgi:hypothetical protein
MENDQLQQQLSGSGMRPLPNATAVLVLGIVSIALCWCYGIVGIISGIIALVLAKKDTALYNASPDFYTQGSYNNLKAGKICAIIGLILSALILIYMIFILVVFGTAILNNPQDFLKKYN